MLRKCVLIVDDYTDSLELLARTFQYAGFTVLVAENGADAVAAATQRHPDAVVMDLQMPVMDGIEATRRIKTDESAKGIPVVAYSAMIRSAWGLELFFAVCQKPCSLDHLVDVVNEAIDSAGRDRLLEGTPRI